MMQRILVAVDGSEPATKALRAAADLAKRLGGKLRVVHALPTYDGGADPWFEPFLEAAEKNAAQMLESAVLAAELPPQEVSTALLRGAAAEAVADEAERWGADLVVVGSRGQNTMARVFLGSVSDRLVHICSRPVLVVR